MTRRTSGATSAAVTRIVAGVGAFEARAGFAHLEFAVRVTGAIAAELPVRTALAAGAAILGVALDGRAGAAAFELAGGAQAGAAGVVTEHALGASIVAAAAMGGIGRRRDAALAAPLLPSGAVRRIQLAGVRSLLRKRRSVDFPRAGWTEPAHERRHERHPQAKPAQEGARCARQGRQRRYHLHTVTEPAACGPRESAKKRSRGAATSEQCGRGAKPPVWWAVRQPKPALALKGPVRTAVSACACGVGAA